MFLLITYILIALVFSFLCSVAEAVILSVTSAHVALLAKGGKGSGKRLKALKADINKPLAAILTLNTIAHTVGAAGAGAQAAKVFGNAYVGIASAVLTLLILVFSEIIPKTLGAHYWRQLAPVTSYGLTGLVWLLYPFVKLSELLTRGLTHGPTLTGFSRQEFAAMADLSVKEGQLAKLESTILKNLLRLRNTPIANAMTPRTVVFSLPERMQVDEFFRKHDHVRFSRIPVYATNHDDVTGFVLRSDLLLAQARGNGVGKLEKYRRDLPVLLATMSLSKAFDEFMSHRAHIMLVVDEYGGMKGLLTLEDLLETLLGLEIVDEGDNEVDMQQLARRLWKRRAKEMDIDLDKLKNS
ncbi:Hemolysin, contains CBS domains [Malonomonas rubra DSM 5091]|uniref:Hemolysin, contains CBS domains n=1 Tax=Malonomonas rubra DSM 5091 TaxID=1122189 RepID=A0A1M6LSN3_MALRU|nr:CNNM domain-containing protein [Malonomonas rubra]SHJ74199.1 Hemolysin, contains CBS domains [Malonomonas rubra DSM 5091]